MKKILFPLILGLAFAAVLGGCTKVNDQFDGFDDATKITNVANYKYTLVDANYKTFGDAIQKPVADLLKPKTDSVKALTGSLTAVPAPTPAEVIVINAKILALNAKIAALQLDPAYVRGYFITADKYLPYSDVIDPVNVAAFLDTKYKYADEKSSALITYNGVTNTDTTAANITLQKFTLEDADYNAMGMLENEPGYYKCFGPKTSPTFYIPFFLKKTFPDAKVGDTWLIHYKYNISTTAINVVNRWIISVFDGTNWSKDGYTTPKVAKYIIKDKKWKFIDSDILIGLDKANGIGSNLGDFTPISVVGEQVWAWNGAYNYMLMTGYLPGPTYLDNEDWLVSPAMNFTERENPALTFNHVGRYFGDVAGSNDKMKTAISVWVSTTSDGTSIVPAEWTKLSLPEEFYPTGNDWKFIPSGILSLAAYKGQSNVRFAFKYLSSNADGAAGSWEVKDVYVYEQ